MAKISGLLSALAILPALNSVAQAQEPLSAREARDLNNIHAIIQVCDAFQLYSIPEPVEAVKTDFTQFCDDVDVIYDTMKETSYKQAEEVYDSAKAAAEQVYDAAKEEAQKTYDAAKKAAQDEYELNKGTDSDAYSTMRTANGEAYSAQRQANGEAYSAQRAANGQAFTAYQAAKGAAFSEYLLDAANLYAERFPNGLQITIAPKTDGSVFIPSAP